jgi:hypothetical protein
MLVCVFFTHFAHGTAGAARIRHFLLPRLSRDDDTQTSGASRRENVDVYLLFEIRIEIPFRHCEQAARHNKTVIARLDRAIQYAAASRSNTTVSGKLGRPVKPGDDSGVCLIHQGRLQGRYRTGDG